MVFNENGYNQLLMFISDNVIMIVCLKKWSYLLYLIIFNCAASIKSSILVLTADLNPALKEEIERGNRTGGLGIIPDESASDVMVVWDLEFNENGAEIIRLTPVFRNNRPKTIRVFSGRKTINPP